MSNNPITTYGPNVPLNLTTLAAVPASLATGNTYTSPVLPLYNSNPFLGTMTGFGAVVVALTADQIVTISVRRYLDLAALIPVEDAVSSATVANTAKYVLSGSSAPAYYVKFTIANASGSTANFTNVGVAALPLAG